jgi:type 1 glutamine amidotransferase/sugar phosphate isomerase/epimerase
MKMRRKSAQTILLLLLAIVLPICATPAAAAPAPAESPNPAARRLVRDPAEQSRIEEAVPAKAIVPPRKPRKLLIFDLNVNYGGHGSIVPANYAFRLMGERTGAFTTIISRAPSVFQVEFLKQFDAVFLNNTVGNLFTDPELRQNLVEFVYGGGGLLGVHGASVAFTQWPGAIEDWPEFGIMLGARGAHHRDSDEHVFIKLDDPGHPLNQVFGGQDFDYRDEFFRVHEPYSRNRVRVLLSIDVAKTGPAQGQARGDCIRADNDYALAWVRGYGRGRVFYSTIAHNPWVFWDQKMLQFYLGAIQFALGDLPAPITPSARLTPPVRAQEKLGWRLGIEPQSARKDTLFEAIDKTAELGCLYIGALSSQTVSKETPKNFDAQLSAEQLRQIRLKLDSAGVHLLTYRVEGLPGDQAGWRRLFSFAKKMGIETLVGGPVPEGLDTVERLCDEHELNFAMRCSVRSSLQKTKSHFWHPDEVAKLCRGRSPRLGACGDLQEWLRFDLDPIKAVRALKDRLIAVQLHDSNKQGADGHDVVWGTGVGQIQAVLQEIHRLGIKPTMFGLEYSTDGFLAKSEAAQCLALFDNVSLQLAK